MPQPSLFPLFLNPLAGSVGGADNLEIAVDDGPVIEIDEKGVLIPVEDE